MENRNNLSKSTENKSKLFKYLLPSKNIWSWIALFACIHIMLSATIGLGDDESYYWVWTKHLSLSYFDHPPMVAYLIAISTHVLGNSTFGVRFFFIILTSLTPIIAYLITIKLYQDKKLALLSLGLVNIIPACLLGGCIVSPDVPLIFFYSLGIYVFITLTHTNKTVYWYLLGIVAGLGMLSKYHMVFLYFGVLLVLILDKNHRKNFKNIHLYLAFLTSILIFSPVIIWNSQHQFISFLFQFYARHDHQLQFEYISALSFIGSQLLLISPVIAVISVYAMYRSIRQPRNLILLCFSLPTLLVFALVSIITPCKPNWAVTAYIPMIIMVTDYFKQCKKIVVAGAYLSIFVCALIILQIYYPIIRIKPLKDDSTSDFYGWNNVAAAVKQFINNQKDPNNWFLFSFTYQLSSQLDYALNHQYPVYSFADHIEGNIFWQNTGDVLGKNGLLVTSNFYTIEPKQWYNCGSVRLYKTINVMRAGIIFRKIFLYECINFKGRSNHVIHQYKSSVPGYILGK